MDGDRERDRARRGDRPSRFSDMSRDRSPDHRPDCRRVVVSNIPYEYKWTDVKDLFKEQVGDVSFVEIYTDDNGKSKGQGIVEFANAEACKKALQVMHRYELKGRKLVLKEDAGNRPNMKNNRPRRDDNDGWRQPEPTQDKYNTYGLSAQFLDSINVQPPLIKSVFVANLDYKTDSAKLKEIFKLAGKVRHVELSVDKDGKSRGFAVIQYDHPVEAVQAISMFHNQTLYDRKMTVRLDRTGVDKFEKRLPDGLKSIGLGLGPNGEPLRDVAKNLPSMQPQMAPQQVAAASNFGSGILGAVPANTGLSLNGLGGLGGGTTNIAPNNALASTLGSLSALGLTGLGALQNQLLQQGLNTNDLASLLQAQGHNLQGSGNSMNNDINNSMNSNPPGAGFGRGLQSSFGGRSELPNREKTSDMVVVNNLPPTVTWQLLREKFSECGEVKFTELTSPDTAIVRFTKEWDAERAIKMFDRTRIDGRTIDVRYL